MLSPHSSMFNMAHFELVRHNKCALDLEPLAGLQPGTWLRF